MRAPPRTPPRKEARAFAFLAAAHRQLPHEFPGEFCEYDSNGESGLLNVTQDFVTACLQGLETYNQQGNKIRVYYPHDPRTRRGLKSLRRDVRLYLQWLDNFSAMLYQILVKAAQILAAEPDSVRGKEGKFWDLEAVIARMIEENCGIVLSSYNSANAYVQAQHGVSRNPDSRVASLKYWESKDILKVLFWGQRDSYERTTKVMVVLDSFDSSMKESIEASQEDFVYFRENNRRGVQAMYDNQNLQRVQNAEIRKLSEQVIQGAEDLNKEAAQGFEDSLPEDLIQARVQGYSLKEKTKARLIRAESRKPAQTALVDPEAPLGTPEWLAKLLDFDEDLTGIPR